MVLRMLRVALPGARRRRRPRARRPGARAAAGGRRLPGVPARGARAAERAARSGASCSTSAPTRTRSRRRSRRCTTALTEADANYRNSAPVLRLGRLQADLDFRSRALDGDDGGVAPMLGHVQHELAQVDADIAAALLRRRVAAGA